MNFAEIENLWRSPHNRPDEAELEKQKMQFITQLQNRRRAAFRLLAFTAIPLACITAGIVSHLMSPRPGLDRVDLGREWALLPFLFLPLVGWFVMLRLYRRHHARHADYESSVQASVQALLDEGRTERTRHIFVAGLLLVSVALLPFIVSQLQATGKAGDEILLPAYVIYPTYVAGMVAWTVYNLRCRLAPRQRELEALLQTYGRVG